jgi:hypothetical protein
MNIQPVYLFSFLIMLLFSCKTKQMQNASNNPDKKYETSSNESKMAFSFRKTACMGFCPTYVADVYQDGTVKYEGLMNVKNIGKFEYKVSKDFLDFVKNTAIELDFMTLKDQYDSPGISDFPSTFLTIYQGDMVKTVEQIGEAPEDLIIFLDEIHKEICKISDCKVDRNPIKVIEE